MRIEEVCLISNSPIFSKMNASALEWPPLFNLKNNAKPGSVPSKVPRSLPNN